MPKRVSPTEKIRADIDELFASEQDIADVLEELMRKSVRLVLQEVLEDEVTTWLGRGWNGRGDRERDGQRNGYGDLTIKTTAGPVDLKRPKLRNTTEAFASAVLGKGVVRTNPLEALVISAWVRGLSDRDCEALLAEALGPEAALSKSTASRICGRLKTEFAEFQSRSLADVEVDYLFLDGSFFKMHDGATAEPVLVAYGITTLGKPVLLAVEPGGDESYDAWKDFLDGLKARGMRPPLLVVTDGAPGLLGAIDDAFRTSLRQRCLIHRSRNVLAKVPAVHREEVKTAFWSLFDDIDAEPGPRAVAIAQKRIDDFEKRYRKTFPSAVDCLLTDRAALTAYLRFPAEHWKRVRHTNLIERTFGETRRRMKVIGRMPGETSCLTLVWAVLDRASGGWRGLIYTPAITRALTELRHQLNHPTPAVADHDNVDADVVTTAA